MNILIVNYNTQKLTDACIKSVNKHTPNTNIYVFDNSDKEPFVNWFSNVKVIDNTKGNIINFEEILSKYPNKTEYASKSGYGSAKHTITIDKCFDIINDNFILLDSDVLVKKDISELYDENYFYVGQIGRTDNVSNLRLLPFCCFINVKELKKNGIRYFSGNKICGLTEDSDKYDTGSSLIIDAEGYPHKDVNINEYVVHYACGSWCHLPTFNGNKLLEEKWLEKYKSLWDNNLDIFICTHKDFDSVVKNDVYKIIDSRNIKEKIFGLDDKELSEFLQIFYAAENIPLNNYVGFCHYRRYFKFMDDIPNMDEIFKECDVIIRKPIKFNHTNREMYDSFHNIDDLNILDDLIKEKYNSYYDAYNAYMNHNLMIGCNNMFIMKKDDFLEYIDFLKNVLKDLIEVIGLNIQERMETNKDKYIKDFYPNNTFEYQHRIYAYLLERLTGVFIIKKFKTLKTYPIIITENKYKKDKQEK